MSSPPPGTYVLIGELEKVGGGLFRIYQKRFFCLDSRTGLWHYAKSHADLGRQRYAGTIDLNKAISVHLNPTNGVELDVTVSLGPGYPDDAADSTAGTPPSIRVYQLRVSTQQWAQRWLTMIMFSQKIRNLKFQFTGMPLSGEGYRNLLQLLEAHKTVTKSPPSPETASSDESNQEDLLTASGSRRGSRADQARPSISLTPKAPSSTHPMPPTTGTAGAPTTGGALREGMDQQRTPPLPSRSSISVRQRAATLSAPPPNILDEAIYVDSEQALVDTLARLSGRRSTESFSPAFKPSVSDSASAALLDTEEGPLIYHGFVYRKYPTKLPVTIWHLQYAVLTTSSFRCYNEKPAAIDAYPNHSTDAIREYMEQVMQTSKTDRSQALSAFAEAVLSPSPTEEVPRKELLSNLNLRTTQPLGVQPQSRIAIREIANLYAPLASQTPVANSSAEGRGSTTSRPTQSTSRSKHFGIKTPATSVLFEALSQEELSTWLNSFQACVPHIKCSPLDLLYTHFDSPTLRPSSQASAPASPPENVRRSASDTEFKRVLEESGLELIRETPTQAVSVTLADEAASQPEIPVDAAASGPPPPGSVVDASSGSKQGLARSEKSARTLLLGHSALAEPVAFEGWLKKKAEKFALIPWRSRYFVLHNDRILYFAEKPPGSLSDGRMTTSDLKVALRTMQAKGSIILSEISAVQFYFSDGKKPKSGAQSSSEGSATNLHSQSSSSNVGSSDGQPVSTRFTIHIENRIYHLMAADVGVAQQWVRVLRLAVRQATRSALGVVSPNTQNSMRVLRPPTFGDPRAGSLRRLNSFFDGSIGRSMQPSLSFSANSDRPSQRESSTLQPMSRFSRPHDRRAKIRSSISTSHAEVSQEQLEYFNDPRMIALASMWNPNKRLAGSAWDRFPTYRRRPRNINSVQRIRASAIKVSLRAVLTAERELTTTRRAIELFFGKMIPPSYPCARGLKTKRKSKLVPYRSTASKGRSPSDSSSSLDASLPCGSDTPQPLARTKSALPSCLFSSSQLQKVVDTEPERVPLPRGAGRPYHDDNLLSQPMVSGGDSEKRKATLPLGASGYAHTGEGLDSVAFLPVPEPTDIEPNPLLDPTPLPHDESLNADGSLGIPSLNVLGTGELSREVDQLTFSVQASFGLPESDPNLAGVIPPFVYAVMFVYAPPQQNPAKMRTENFAGNYPIPPYSSVPRGLGLAPNSEGGGKGSKCEDDATAAAAAAVVARNAMMAAAMAAHSANSTIPTPALPSEGMPSLAQAPSLVALASNPDLSSMHSQNGLDPKGDPQVAINRSKLLAQQAASPLHGGSIQEVGQLLNVQGFESDPHLAQLVAASGGNIAAGAHPMYVACFHSHNEQSPNDHHQSGGIPNTHLVPVEASTLVSGALPTQYPMTAIYTTQAVGGVIREMDVSVSSQNTGQPLLPPPLSMMPSGPGPALPHGVSFSTPPVAVTPPPLGEHSSSEISASVSPTQPQSVAPMMVMAGNYPSNPRSLSQSMSSNDSQSSTDSTRSKSPQPPSRKVPTYQRISPTWLESVQTQPLAQQGELFEAPLMVPRAIRARKVRCMGGMYGDVDVGTTFGSLYEKLQRGTSKDKVGCGAWCRSTNCNCSCHTEATESEPCVLTSKEIQSSQHDPVKPGSLDLEPVEGLVLVDPSTETDQLPFVSGGAAISSTPLPNSTKDAHVKVLARSAAPPLRIAAELTRVGRDYQVPQELLDTKPRSHSTVSMNSTGAPPVVAVGEQPLGSRVTERRRSTLPLDPLFDPVESNLDCDGAQRRRSVASMSESESESDEESSTSSRSRGGHLSRSRSTMVRGHRTDSDAALPSPSATHESRENADSVLHDDGSADELEIELPVYVVGGPNWKPESSNLTKTGSSNSFLGEMTPHHQSLEDSAPLEEWIEVSRTEARRLLCREEMALFAHLGGVSLAAAVANGTPSPTTTSVDATGTSASGPQNASTSTFSTSIATASANLIADSVYAYPDPQLGPCWDLSALGFRQLPPGANRPNLAPAVPEKESESGIGFGIVASSFANGHTIIPPLPLSIMSLTPTSPYTTSSDVLEAIFGSAQTPQNSLAENPAGLAPYIGIRPGQTSVRRNSTLETQQAFNSNSNGMPGKLTALLATHPNVDAGKLAPALQKLNRFNTLLSLYVAVPRGQLILDSRPLRLSPYWEPASSVYYSKWLAFKNRHKLFTHADLAAFVHDVLQAEALERAKNLVIQQRQKKIQEVDASVEPVTAKLIPNLLDKFESYAMSEGESDVQVETLGGPEYLPIAPDALGAIDLDADWMQHLENFTVADAAALSDLDEGPNYTGRYYGSDPMLDRTLVKVAFYRARKPESYKDPLNTTNELGSVIFSVGDVLRAERGELQCPIKLAFEKDRKWEGQVKIAFQRCRRVLLSDSGRHCYASFIASARNVGAAIVSHLGEVASTTVSESLTRAAVIDSKHESTAKTISLQRTAERQRRLAAQLQQKEANALARTSVGPAASESSGTQSGSVSGAKAGGVRVTASSAGSKGARISGGWASMVRRSILPSPTQLRQNMHLTHEKALHAAIALITNMHTTARERVVALVNESLALDTGARKFTTYGHPLPANVTEVALSTSAITMLINSTLSKIRAMPRLYHAGVRNIQSLLKLEQNRMILQLLSIYHRHFTASAMNSGKGPQRSTLTEDLIALKASEAAAAASASTAITGIVSAALLPHTRERELDLPPTSDLVVHEDLISSPYAFSVPAATLATCYAQRSAERRYMARILSQLLARPGVNPQVAVQGSPVSLGEGGSSQSKQYEVDIGLTSLEHPATCTCAACKLVDKSQDLPGLEPFLLARKVMYDLCNESVLKTGISEAQNPKLAQRIRILLASPILNQRRLIEHARAVEACETRIAELDYMLNRYRILAQVFANYRGQYRRLFFKPSSFKFDPVLDLIATNMNIHTVTMVRMPNRPKTPLYDPKWVGYFESKTRAELEAPPPPQADVISRLDLTSADALAGPTSQLMPTGAAQLDGRHGTVLGPQAIIATAAASAVREVVPVFPAKPIMSQPSAHRYYRFSSISTGAFASHVNYNMGIQALMQKVARTAQNLVHAATALRKHIITAASSMAVAAQPVFGSFIGLPPALPLPPPQLPQLPKPPVTPSDAAGGSPSSSAASPPNGPMAPGSPPHVPRDSPDSSSPLPPLPQRRVPSQSPVPSMPLPPVPPAAMKKQSSLQPSPFAPALGSPVGPQGTSLISGQSMSNPQPQYVVSPDMAGQLAMSIEELSSAAYELDRASWELELRKIPVLTQAITGLVTAFVTALATSSPEHLRRIPRAGYLVTAESLLSTAADEQAMINDYQWAMSQLNNVRIRIIPARNKGLSSNVKSAWGPTLGPISEKEVTTGADGGSSAPLPSFQTTPLTLPDMALDLQTSFETAALRAVTLNIAAEEATARANTIARVLDNVSERAQPTQNVECQSVSKQVQTTVKSTASTPVAFGLGVLQAASQAVQDAIQDRVTSWTPEVSASASAATLTSGSAAAPHAVLWQCRLDAHCRTPELPVPPVVNAAYALGAQARREIVQGILARTKLGERLGLDGPSGIREAIQKRLKELHEEQLRLQDPTKPRGDKGAATQVDHGAIMLAATRHALEAVERLLEEDILESSGEFGCSHSRYSALANEIKHNPTSETGSFLPLLQSCPDSPADMHSLLGGCRVYVQGHNPHGTDVSEPSVRVAEVPYDSVIGHGREATYGEEKSISLRASAPELKQPFERAKHYPGIAALNSPLSGGTFMSGSAQRQAYAYGSPILPDEVFTMNRGHDVINGLLHQARKVADAMSAKDDGHLSAVVRSNQVAQGASQRVGTFEHNGGPESSSSGDLVTDKQHRAETLRVGGESSLVTQRYLESLGDRAMLDPMARMDLESLEPDDFYRMDSRFEKRLPRIDELADRDAKETSNGLNASVTNSNKHNEAPARGSALKLGMNLNTGMAFGARLSTPDASIAQTLGSRLDPVRLIPATSPFSRAFKPPPQLATEAALYEKFYARSISGGMVGTPRPPRESTPESQNVSSAQTSESGTDRMADASPKPDIPQPLPLIREGGKPEPIDGLPSAVLTALLQDRQLGSDTDGEADEDSVDDSDLVASEESETPSGSGSEADASSDEGLDSDSDSDSDPEEQVMSPINSSSLASVSSLVSAVSSADSLEPLSSQPQLSLTQVNEIPLFIQESLKSESEVEEDSSDHLPSDEEGAAELAAAAVEALHQELGLEAPAQLPLVEFVTAEVDHQQKTLPSQTASPESRDDEDTTKLVLAVSHSFAALPPAQEEVSHGRSKTPPLLQSPRQIHAKASANTVATQAYVSDDETDTRESARLARPASAESSADDETQAAEEALRERRRRIYIERKLQRKLNTRIARRSQAHWFQPHIAGALTQAHDKFADDIYSLMGKSRRSPIRPPKDGHTHENSTENANSLSVQTLSPQQILQRMFDAVVEARPIPDFSFADSGAAAEANAAADPYTTVWIEVPQLLYANLPCELVGHQWQWSYVLHAPQASNDGNESGAARAALDCTCEGDAVEWKCGRCNTRRHACLSARAVAQALMKRSNVSYESLTPRAYRIEVNKVEDAPIIPVVSCFFTQGVNERQYLARLRPSAILQQVEINRYGAGMLREYAHRYMVTLYEQLHALYFSQHHVQTQIQTLAVAWCEHRKQKQLARARKRQEILQRKGRQPIAAVSTSSSLIAAPPCVRVEGPSRQYEASPDPPSSPIPSDASMASAAVAMGATQVKVQSSNPQNSEFPIFQTPQNVTTPRSQPARIEASQTKLHSITMPYVPPPHYQPHTAYHLSQVTSDEEEGFDEDPSELEAMEFEPDVEIPHFFGDSKDIVAIASHPLPVPLHLFAKFAVPHSLLLPSQILERRLLTELSGLDNAAGKGEKRDAEILAAATRVVRLLEGSLLVSCKSAKDRTSMSVTLEAARALEREGVTREEAAHVLNCMRSEGVRRANVIRNTGKKKYAFNSLQRNFLPPQLTPPEVACSGKTES